MENPILSNRLIDQTDHQVNFLCGCCATSTLPVCSKLEYRLIGKSINQSINQYILINSGDNICEYKWLDFVPVRQRQRRGGIGPGPGGGGGGKRKRRRRNDLYVPVKSRDCNPGSDSLSGKPCRVLYEPRKTGKKFFTTYREVERRKLTCCAGWTQQPPTTFGDISDGLSRDAQPVRLNCTRRKL